MEREDVLGRLLEIAADESRILAVLEGGSAVVGATDEFSDLDLVVVCTEAGRPDLLAEAFAARLGPLLASFIGDHVGEPRLRICLYGPPLVHVDLKFVTEAELGDRIEDAILRWERKPGLVAAASSSPAVWPQPDLQWIEDRFWVWVHYLATKIGRGEWFDCIDGLAYLRAAVFGPLLAVRAGYRPQGARRLERYAGPSLSELNKTIGGPTREDCIVAVRAAIGLYQQLRAEAQAPVEPRTAAEAASLDYLAEIEQAGR